MPPYSGSRSFARAKEAPIQANGTYLRDSASVRVLMLCAPIARPCLYLPAVVQTRWRAVSRREDYRFTSSPPRLCRCVYVPPSYRQSKVQCTERGSRTSSVLPSTARYLKSLCRRLPPHRRYYAFRRHSSIVYQRNLHREAQGSGGGPRLLSEARRCILFRSSRSLATPRADPRNVLTIYSPALRSIPPSLLRGRSR